MAHYVDTHYIDAHYIDAHCHLSDQRLEATLDQVIEQANAAHIQQFVLGGVEPIEWQRQLELKAKYPGQIITSFGLHPWWVANHTEIDCEQAFMQLKLHLPQAQALGELGLDLQPQYKDTFTKQLHFFKLQLQLSQKLPLVLHVVHAHAEVLDVLKNHTPIGYRGLVHSFWGSYEQAKNYLDLGFHLSFSAAVVRRKSAEMREVIEKLPLQKILIESDSPDQHPLGKNHLNSPLSILQTAEIVAQWKRITTEQVLSSASLECQQIFC